MTDQLMQAQTMLPFSEEAEQALLGAIILDPAVFLEIATFIEGEDFFIKRHEYIWSALYRLQDRNDDIDYLTLSNELEGLGRLNEIGGQPYLINLVNNTPSAVHAEIYGRLVQRASLRRKLLKASDEVRRLALDEESPIDKVISDSEAEIFNVSGSQVKREFVSVADALSDYYDEIERLLEGESALGQPTGFRALDGLLGGFQRSDLIVFAGRPGMGKTSWLLTVALNVARRARVALFTMEMGVEQMAQRLIAMETGLGIQQLRSAKISPARTKPPGGSDQPPFGLVSLHRRYAVDQSGGDAHQMPPPAA